MVACRRVGTVSWVSGERFLGQSRGYLPLCTKQSIEGSSKLNVRKSCTQWLTRMNLEPTSLCTRPFVMHLGIVPHLLRQAAHHRSSHLVYSFGAEAFVLVRGFGGSSDALLVLEPVPKSSLHACACRRFGRAPTVGSWEEVFQVKKCFAWDCKLAGDVSPKGPMPRRSRRKAQRLPNITMHNIPVTKTDCTKCLKHHACHKLPGIRSQRMKL